MLLDDPARTFHLPGPAPFPLVGALGNVARFTRDAVGNAGALFAKYGPIAGVVGGDLRSRPPLARWVFAYGPEPAREIFSQHHVFHKPPLTKHLHPRGERTKPREQALQRWGTGLFNVNEDEHRRHRRLMMPAFHKGRVEAYRAQIVELVEEELAQWRPGAVRDVRDDMMFLTLRVAARCLLGEREVERGAQSVGALIQRTIRMLLRPSVTLLPIDLPGTPYHRFLDAVERTDAVIRAMIAKKRARGADEADVLSMLIQARDEGGFGLTEDQLIGHAGLIFIAGHETSSNALTWTLLLLSQHPKIAHALLDELEGELRGAAPTVEQLGRLPLLDAVLNLRITGREGELGGHALPAATNVVLSIFHTHRMPELHANPARFDPRRWESFKPEPYQFFPFGAGPRTCIGAAFAMMEMKLILAMLLQRFRLELLPATRVDRFLSVAMTVKDPLPMQVHAQDRRFERGAGALRGDVREMLDLPA